jgi:3D (Asp-Asp-Asp) domain-containing protein
MRELLIGLMIISICLLASITVKETDSKTIERDIYKSNTIINNGIVIPQEDKPQIDKPTEKKWINIIATAYTASAAECGNSKGITASGKKVSYSRGTIAAPKDIAFETKIVIPELNKTFVVEDRGNKNYIKRIDKDTIRIDVYMQTKAEAIKFGVKKLRGYIEE